MTRAIKGHFTVIGLLLSLSIGFSQPLYADKWQEGTATIGNNNIQKKCPVGTAATARSAGCKHDHCSAAKNQAKANLRGQVPTECHKYIHATDTCKPSPDC